MRPDFRRDRGHGADRDAQNDKVSLRHRRGGRVRNLVAEAQLAGQIAALRRAGVADDLGPILQPPRRPGDGAADQAKADQRDAVEAVFAHTRPRNSVIAAIRASHSSSEPMEIRRCAGRP